MSLPYLWHLFFPEYIFLKLRVVTSCFQPIKKQWLSVTSLTFIHLDSFLTKLKKYIGSRESLFRIRRKDTSAVSSSPTMLGKRVSCIFLCENPYPLHRLDSTIICGRGDLNCSMSVKLQCCQSLENWTCGWTVKNKKQENKKTHWLLKISQCSCGRSLLFIFTPFKKETVFSGVLLQQHLAAYCNM